MQIGNTVFSFNSTSYLFKGFNSMLKYIRPFWLQTDNFSNGELKLYLKLKKGKENCHFKSVKSMYCQCKDINAYFIFLWIKCYEICFISSELKAQIHKARFELRPRFELKPPFVSPNLLLFFTNQVCKKRVKRVI